MKFKNKMKSNLNFAWFNYLNASKILLFIFFFNNLSSQVNPSFWKTDSNRNIIEKYTKNSKIDLDSLRCTSNLLTDYTVLRYGEIVLPDRKKAFVRHIKHINEKLEEYYFENKNIDLIATELILELEYLKISFLQKGHFEMNKIFTLSDKLNLVKNTFQSKKHLSFKLIDKKDLNDPETPYWKTPVSNPSAQFDFLAKQKKIKAQENKVVIFEGFNDGGSIPKIKALDTDLDNEWLLKWGDEIHSDIVASRIFASLGYDVDHPYVYFDTLLTLVFDSTKTITTWSELRDSVLYLYKVDIQPFLKHSGKVTEQMSLRNSKLKPYVGKNYVQFYKCGLEARPDRVKRLGSFLPSDCGNEDRLELKGSLLVHALIGNWDTREENTMLSIIHEGNYNYHTSAAFTDLGSSFGVTSNLLKLDFKTGMVNYFSWEVVSKKRNKIVIHNPINAVLEPFKKADYNDLYWMALKISKLDSLTIRTIINKAKWPKPLEELYFHKLVSRRASILKAFDIVDPHNIHFDKNLTFRENGKLIIKKGKLKVEIEPLKNPESFIKKKGRNRNYGH